jgi:hypothetical protein
VKFCDAVMGYFEIYQNLGNNAYDSAVSGQGRLGNGLHQTNIRTSINHANIPGGESVTQVLGSYSIGRMKTSGGGTKDSDVANHTMRISSV